MTWVRSQLFWRTLGLFVLLSLLPLSGLLMTLNSRLEEEAEQRYRLQLRDTAELIRGQVASDKDLATTMEGWHEAASSGQFLLWLVDVDGTLLSPSPVPPPDRPAVRSTLLTAFQAGTAERWIEEYGTRQRVLVIALRCSPKGVNARILLITGYPGALVAPETAAADVATKAAIFTWLAAVICVAVVAAGLVSPLQAMTRNLKANVEEIHRQDMLLRISDRHDELGDVAQSLTQLEGERRQQMTDLTSADSHSRANVELLSAVLDAMMEGVIAVDEAERILFINAAARKLMTISNVIQPGHWLYEAVRIPPVLETVGESIATQELQSLEFRATRDDRHLMLVVNPIRRQPVAGAVLVIRDISETRRLEVMRRDFVSGVSHELKTPLTVIQACTDTLLGGALDDREAAQRFLHQIDEQSERLLHLVLGMLQLSRVESGAEVFTFEDVCVKDIVDDVFRQLKPLADAQDVRLVFHGNDQLTVHADQRALETIVNNLVTNAIKNSPHGADVRVEAVRHADDHRAINVVDTGPGIAAELQHRVFERFYRIDRDRSRDKGGTGLGLAIVKHLCQTMRADVSIRSEIGKGATFEVRFSPQVVSVN